MTPCGKIDRGTRVWYVVTDEWPEQAVEEGTVLRYDEVLRCYVLDVGGTLEEINEERVFTEPIACATLWDLLTHKNRLLYEDSVRRVKRDYLTRKEGRRTDEICA